MPGRSINLKGSWIFSFPEGEGRGFFLKFSSEYKFTFHTSTTPFSFFFFLMPVYFFALSQVNHIDWFDAVLAFLILHLLVYPSSNGYNSYMDRDTSPIGGLEKPLQPTRQLFIVTVYMDMVAVGISLFITWLFALGILLYILASRAYSYRKIRLKKYPIAGYMTVVIFQGRSPFFSISRYR